MRDSYPEGPLEPPEYYNPPIEWEELDISTLSDKQRLSYDYEMDHRHCGVTQIVSIFTRKLELSPCYCQHCGEQIDIDDKTMDEIIEDLRVNNA